jgi:hypothetical protein
VDVRLGSRRLLLTFEQISSVVLLIFLEDRSRDQIRSLLSIYQTI